jgi:rhamnose utilization protein RhaD (predicted bifunctional aldolase and dehydrogenase)
MDSFFERNAAALRDFARVSQKIGARSDYVQGGGGNTSVKLGGGLMAIKASGYRLCDITPKPHMPCWITKRSARFMLRTSLPAWGR